MSGVWVQVKNDILYRFCYGDHKDAEGAPPRNAEYIIFNTVYVFAEFFAWLEVIRQEIVFVTGANPEGSDLNSLFSIIKFQFTGDPNSSSLKWT